MTLAGRGAELLRDVVDGIAARHRYRGPPERRADLSLRSSTLDDGRDPVGRAARRVLGRIRGVTPEPGAHTTLDGARLKMLAAPAPAEDAAARRRRDRALAGAPSASARHPTPIVLERVQPAGKAAMARRRLVARPARDAHGGGT